MPLENVSFRSICGRFATIFVFFMEKCAKLAATMFGYNTRARRAQVPCVFLTVVLMQVLLCANDIEMHPGPNEEMEQTVQRMFDQQKKRFETLFSDQFETRFETLGNQLLIKIESILSAVTTQLVNIQGKIAELEEHYLCMTDAQTKTNHTVQDLEKLRDFSIEVEDKIDRLEAFSRRDNLKFFNIPQSRNESSDTCTETLFVRHGVMWSRDDIVRAHRFGNNNNNNGYTKPQPIITKFAKWSDKMDILTKGKQQLTRKGVRVAGDLTTRQQKVIKDYRGRGQRAYYKGNKLVVAGPLPPRRWNQDSYADAARRRHHRRQDNPGTAASRGRRRANIYRTSNPGDGRESSAKQADSWQQTTHGTADDCWGG